MNRPAQVSFVFIIGVLVLAGALHLGIPLIAILFSYFTLTKLRVGHSKALPVISFLIIAAAMFYGFGFFLKEAFVALPEIAAKALPVAIDYAKEQKIELPFTDLESLRALALESIKEQLKTLASFARIATKEFVLMVIGMVVAIGLFLNPKLDLDRERHTLRNNVYTVYCDAIAERFGNFYRSFSSVMGAQIIISAINALLTAIFVIWLGLPYRLLVVVLTFVCGLIPIIGNIISNTVIVGIAITISFKWAIAALIFLVVLHKLEYFLNSKIIGHAIRNPMWLTLLSLILGERLMGIPGMILAPVVLNYIKVEASRIPTGPAGPANPAPAPGSKPHFSSGKPVEASVSLPD